MKNKYLKNLNKIEFVLTYACTGKCKHCSEGDHDTNGEKIHPIIAANIVREVAPAYDIKTVMVFGGEPLLHTDAVYEIMNAARDMNVERRQVITNGYFSKNIKKIAEVAKNLAACGVNDLLLSVDSFHEESIPIEYVKAFASEIKKCGIPARLSPAWLVSAIDNNPYNIKTREILKQFNDIGIPTSEGNIVFPEGNARIYLSEYFNDCFPKNPYVEDSYDVKCLSVSPNGDVLDGNIYKQCITQILDNYTPKS